jgi:hypothetical protein
MPARLGVLKGTASTAVALALTLAPGSLVAHGMGSTWVPSRTCVS